MQWIFAVIAVHPALRSITSVSDTTRDDLNRSVAHVIERLLSESCRIEARAALASGNTGMLENSFGILGQTAMVDLFSDPAVIAALSGLEKYFDSAKLQKALASDSIH